MIAIDVKSIKDPSSGFKERLDVNAVPSNISHGAIGLLLRLLRYDDDKDSEGYQIDRKIECALIRLLTNATRFEPPLDLTAATDQGRTVLSSICMDGSEGKLKVLLEGMSYMLKNY